MNNTRECRICSNTKSLTYFPFNGKSYDTTCNECLPYRRHKVPHIEKPCPGCGQVLPFFRYRYSKRYPDLLEPLCKECENTMQVCHSCERALPFDWFHKNGTLKDGKPKYYTFCKDCWFISVKGGDLIRVCEVCGEEKPASEFVSRNYTRGGYEPLCRQCQKTHKKCSDCGVIKPLSMFRPTDHIRTDGTRTPDSKCYDCRLAYDRISDKEWRKTNPDSLRLIGERRRKKYAHLRNDITIEEWQMLLEWSHNHCLCCAKEFSNDRPSDVATADHIYNGSCGLMDGMTIRNAQPLCRTCNGRKGDRHCTDYRPLAWRERVYSYILKQGVIKGDELIETYNLLFNFEFNQEVMYQ